MMLLLHLTLLAALSQLSQPFDAHASPLREHPRVAGRAAERSLPLPDPSGFSARSIVTPGEFAPSDELQMTVETFDLLAESLVGTVEKSARLVVLASDPQDAAEAHGRYARAGGDAARLRTWVAPYDSLWYQDYGPIYSIDTTSDPRGELVGNDFAYNRFGRRADDAVPAAIAALEGTRNQPVAMNYEGGNFISDGRGTCLASSRVYEQNPQLTGAQVDELLRANLGCLKMVILTPLVDDDTFHIDLFAKLVSEKTILVGDFVDHAENKRIMDQNARALADLGYRVERVPVRSRGRGNYLSHINSFLINGYALLPAYDVPEDQVAARKYAELGYQPLLVPAQTLENRGGAIHCILRSRPTVVSTGLQPVPVAPR